MLAVLTSLFCYLTINSIGHDDSNARSFGEFLQSNLPPLPHLPLSSFPAHIFSHISQQYFSGWFAWTMDAWDFFSLSLSTTGVLATINAHDGTNRPISDITTGEFVGLRSALIAMVFSSAQLIKQVNHERVDLFGNDWTVALIVSASSSNQNLYFFTSVFIPLSAITLTLLFRSLGAVVFG